MLAPMLYPRDQYLEDKEAAKTNGEMSIFMAEYHSNPTISDDESTFTENMFEEYDKLDGRNIFHYILYDPAMPPSGRTRIKAVDKSAIIVLATDSDKNWWVEEVHANRAVPTDNYELIFRLVKKYNKTFRRAYMETIAAQRAMYLNMKDIMKQRGIKFPLEEVPSHKGSKEARIEQLQPLYATNRIKHKKGQCDELETELLLFGNTNHDDISDALSFGLNRVKYPSKGEIKKDSRIMDAYDKMFNKATSSTNWKIV
jgi:predicted phage terminase large subunit-like protein